MIPIPQHRPTKPADKDEKVCAENYCKAKVINFFGMKQCLESNFARGTDLLFDEDGDEWIKAIMTNVPRKPASIVFVKNTNEVKIALACAVDNGYRVSGRGGGHSFQGLGTMDGHVVIDMTQTCNPAEFVINKNDKGPHIIEGSEYIGTMTGQSGCTNSVMVGMGHKYFGAEGGMTLLGACPSVGITGYLLGGGAGAVSPYVGMLIDVVKDFTMVKWDGTVVKASKEENPDLFWAARGGGGGHGIITHMTYKIIKAAKQKYEKEIGNKFTYFSFKFIAPNSLEEALDIIQEWYYDGDNRITSRFGGSFGSTPIDDEYGVPSFLFGFYVQGGWKEAIEMLETTGLLREEFVGNMDHALALVPFNQALLIENYEVLCETGANCPQMGAYGGGLIKAVQFDKYVELMAQPIVVGFGTPVRILSKNI